MPAKELSKRAIRWLEQGFSVAMIEF